MKPSRYEAAGVSIDAQDKAIAAIVEHVRTTDTERVLSKVGSFGGLFDISFPEMKQPVLVSSTDGVGTKLRIAFETGIHDTVGQCLVNHCINDILVQGARPLFFMDYIATGKILPGVVAEIVRGMTVACRQSGLSLLGGEMAEMPGFYNKDEYDIAGFIVGVVDRPKILGAGRVRIGDRLLGLPSTGLHTNGYSLARKIVFEEQGLRPGDRLPGLDATVADALLAIHRPYYHTLAGLLEQDAIAAMAHITGGGFLDNLPRILPDQMDAHIRTDSYPIPPLFRFLVERGGIEREEAYRVFNMGIGMILVVRPEQVRAALEHLAGQGMDVHQMGEIRAGTGKVQLV